MWISFTSPNHASSKSSGRSPRLAPRWVAIVRSPSGPTRTAIAPVGSAAQTGQTSTPRASRSATSRLPRSSSPTLVTRLTDSLHVAGSFDRCWKYTHTQRGDQSVERVLFRTRRDKVASLERLIDLDYPARRDIGRAADRACAAHRKRRKEHGVAAGEDAEAGKFARGDAASFEVFEVAA